MNHNLTVSSRARSEEFTRKREGSRAALSLKLNPSRDQRERSPRRIINVTGALDEGPVIEQTRISHRNQVEDLVRNGRDLERTVLARALGWHLEHRILCYSNKTVVFDERIP